MATLQKIRNRAGLLVAVVIGMALFAFILGDMLNSGSALFSGSKNDVAQINGSSIPIQEFQKTIDELVNITKFSSQQSSLDEATYDRIMEQSWQKILRQYVLEDEYQELGIGVSGEELWDMIQGENLHPIIRQLFTNPETGMVNTIAIIQFLKTYDQDPSGNQQAYWLFLEDEIVNDRKFQKYSNLIQKGLYVTNAEAQMEYNNSSRSVDFDFVVQRFNTIPDSLITITKGDLKDYYQDHQRSFDQEASRDIEYIVFEVLPSEDDRLLTERAINDIKFDFASTQNDREFVNLSSDKSYIEKNYTPDDVQPEVAEFMLTAEIGDIYGPYFEEGAFKLAKIFEYVNVSDSVKARHILIGPDRESGMIEPTIALADSLIELIKNGRSFASLAIQYSEDRGSAQDGGDLGWFPEGVMFQSFSDTCFSANVGDIKTAITNYGVHIIEVLDKSSGVKKSKIAFVERELTPSSKTYQDFYSQASMFAGNNHTYERFISAVEEQGLIKKAANSVKASDKQIAGLENPRAFIRAAFEVEEGEIISSQNNAIFEMENLYVVGYVKEARKEGVADIDEVENQIMVELRKQKKADQIILQIEEQLSISSSLDDLANALNLTIEEAVSINFRSYSIPVVGIEPAVISTAANLSEGELSNPIQGLNGVYLVRAKSVSEPDENADFEMQRTRMMMQFQNRANYEAYTALQEASNIVDNRARYY